MSPEYPIAEKLISEFTGNYMEKVFYFCLRKTGNVHEAEDLAQDITLNIVYMLRKGHIPDSFSAWVWKIARNRYCLWAKKKHIKLDSLVYNDVFDIELADEDVSAEDKMILKEDISYLRRELAFISSEYRDIVVAYYIEDRKLKDIASSLNLSEGTVKSKLFYARKKLKEGMNMAREFGKRSYRPEEICFAASGSQPSGLPWSAVQRKTPKNILLEASNNPSTLEELSVELGIALPYVEEEVEILHKATLLKKDGDKYVTNFFIQSKECQMEMYLAKKNNISVIAKFANNIASDSLNEVRSLGVVKNNMSDNDLKWWIYIFLIHHCVVNVEGINDRFPVIREDKNESWGFTGYEMTEIHENICSGYNGIGLDDYMLWHFKIPIGKMWEGIPESRDYRDALLLKEAVINGKNVKNLTVDEKNTWKRIENKLAHADENGNVIPDVVVVTRESRNAIREMFKSHRDYIKLMESCQKVFDDLMSILKKESNPILHNQLVYNATMDIFYLRTMAANEAVKMNYLTVPEHPERTTIGISLHI